MVMYTVPLVLAAIVACCSAEPSWTTFRVTWGSNPFSSRAFALLPSTSFDAENNGWVRLPGDCEGGVSLGRRYMKGGDVATILLYDINGFIAGMQYGLHKEEVDKADTGYDFSSDPYLWDEINNQEVYFLTAYFVDPSIICTRGRTQKQYEEQGAGTGIYFQTDRNERNTTQAPLYEKNTPGTKWVEGGCYRTIGKHYWYDVRDGMDCRKQVPFFLVYNRGKLTGFGFASVGKYDFSNRFEHPSKEDFESYLPQPVPSCISNQFDKANGYTVLHVFFSVRPWNLAC